MKEIEKKYGFERGNIEQSMRSRFKMSSQDDDEYFKYKSFMHVYGDKFEQNFKDTLKKWVDTPKNIDFSKNIISRNNAEVITEVRKETLPDGTKVYHAKEGYFNLFYDGGFGLQLSEDELKKHGLELNK